MVAARVSSVTIFFMVFFLSARTVVMILHDDDESAGSRELKVFWAQRRYGLDLTVLNRDAQPPFVVLSHLAGNEEADEIVARLSTTGAARQSKRRDARYSA